MQDVDALEQELEITEQTDHIFNQVMQEYVILLLSL